MMQQTMDWDTPIDTNNTTPYPRHIILPDGDYDYVIVDFVRGEYPGSAKIGRCPKATLTLRITTDAGDIVDIKTDLILHTKLVWKLAAFFVSAGLMQPGETGRMPWDRVIGASGRARITTRTYTRNSKTYTINDVDAYLPPTTNQPDTAGNYVPVDNNSDGLPWD